jgi:GT2 family glycosyltransferase
MNDSPTTATAEEQDELASLESPPSITASVDFAHLLGNRLLVYGWIFGVAKQLHRAFIVVGDVEIDLQRHARTVPRPDVSLHFSTAPGEELGFYLLVDLQRPAEDAESLLLRVALPSGETQESRWAFQRHDPAAFSLPPSDFATLSGVLRTLPAMDRARLARVLSQDAKAGRELAVSHALPLGIRLEIDFCCVLDQRVLVVYGWLLDPAEAVVALELGVGNEVFDLLNGATAVPRLDIASEEVAEQRGAQRGRAPRLPGFLFVQVIPETLAAASEAIFAVAALGAEPACLARQLGWYAYQSRSEVFALIRQMDVATGMLLIERILSAARELPGTQSLVESLELNHDRLVERLPPSIQDASLRSRFWLHLDQAIPVAGAGIFLAGWSYAEGDIIENIFCHCGDSRIAVDAEWIRHSRPDVTTYLEAAGVDANDHEHGFTCYVPIHREDRPYWLSILSVSGEERRMHVPAAEQKKTSLQTVRSLLGAFHCQHRQLRALMDRQVGPAVEAAWTARQAPASRAIVETFGAVPPHPEVSIIVPLYRRWDFAEYQMSQFANDPSFREVDLIYVVDDPSIYDQFRNAAPNLFGIYGIPFTIAYPGANLGFAGANNFGASYARGIFILLLNSDVLPKRPGWLGDLVETHESLFLPGLLGAKLLYEDGTLQHAGIEFRRHAPWEGLWINDHPLKGQVCPQLKGVREVPAVTAACALIDADLFRELGGLSEDYIIGDFEDSDLCLRAKQAGRKNYVALDVELYHLERQSQNHTGDALWRTNLTAYNCWLHNKRWSAEIEAIANGASPSQRNGDLPGGGEIESLAARVRP